MYRIDVQNWIHLFNERVYLHGCLVNLLLVDIIEFKILIYCQILIVQAIINFILHYIADLDIPIKRLADKI